VTLVVDSSVAVKWVVEEDGRDDARALLFGDGGLLAPEFVTVEAADVLSIKVQRGQMEPAQALGGIATIRSAFSRLLPDADLADEALRISLELRHPVYDCLYLACASRTDAEFVTADKKLINKLRATGGWTHVHSLTS
jgi:predicted nucleic acid-binding protein